MKVVIFLGPSLRAERARAVFADASDGPAPELVILPPAAMGDLYGALGHQPDAIGLIDGLFEQVPAVWHKEVLYALSSGVQVYGASSMGALRAAELHPFGMRGVGRIFEVFRSGELEDDDEVAVAHRPAEDGYAPLSEAMVNIRFAVAAAEARGTLAPETARRLIELGKTCFYPLRSWFELRDRAREAKLPAEELDAFFADVRQRKPDAKGDDAVALLERIRADIAAGLSRHEPSFVFQSSVYWERIEQNRAQVVGDAEHSGVPHEAMIRHVQLTSPEWRSIARAALLAHLAELEADRRGGAPVSGEALGRRWESLRRERGLVDQAATERWRARNGLDDDELERAVTSEARVEELFARCAPELTSALMRELRLRGIYADTRDAVQRKLARLRERAVVQLTAADVGLDDDELAQWYLERYQPPAGPLALHAAECGFHSQAELVAELAALRLLEQEPDAH